MSREPYDPQQAQITALEGIEQQLKRIADALERAHPARKSFYEDLAGDFGSMPDAVIPKIDTTAG